MKTSKMKFHSSFLELNYSLGESETNLKLYGYLVNFRSLLLRYGSTCPLAYGVYVEPSIPPGSFPCILIV